MSIYIYIEADYTVFSVDCPSYLVGFWCNFDVRR